MSLCNRVLEVDDQNNHALSNACAYTKDQVQKVRR